ncbi:coenzyme F420 hydrogenase [Clostridiales bacterium TF09-2AC]|nr:coenzyme F420 hydrogenase [Clostridiales bacterium TF09-2AC]
MIEVYDSKAECCGCGVCAQVCPKSAIEMETDECGFLFPVISQELCIDCGLCQRKCPFKKNHVNTIKQCYAAVSSDDRLLTGSASGGMFSAFANLFLNKGGCVCGATLEIDRGVASIKHIVIESLEELPKLQGSKYVQSYMQEVFDKVLGPLMQGRKVLFSGTPCQVAAMKTLVGNRFRKSLYTIDIICHGVPSQKMFNDYIQTESKRRKIIIQDFKFRDKAYGWGLNGSIYGINIEGNVVKAVIHPDCSSYYHFFLNGEIYRDCCYQCPFAQKKRTGDLSIGDYWGAEKYSPELMDENGGPFSKQTGVSCLMINTEAGAELLDDMDGLILKKPVDFSKIAIVNTQLSHPAAHTSLRMRLMTLYTQKGYQGIEYNFQVWRRKAEMKRCAKRTIKQILPIKAVSAIKKFLKV